MVVVRWGLFWLRCPLSWGLVGVALLALTAAGTVLAVNPSKEKVAFTPVGRAQARAEVVHRSDVGAGWLGGFRKPKLSSTLPGCSYQPKQSDLVLIGAAESRWQKPPFLIDSVAQVLRTAAMVSLDWRRSVLAPQVQPCLRRALAKSIGSNGRLVSFRRVSFPEVARYVHAYRTVADVTTPNGSVAADVDLVVLGGGRNELTLTFTGPAAERTALRNAEVRLARRLARRSGP